jgi:hypothetical protein
MCALQRRCKGDAAPIRRLAEPLHRSIRAAEQLVLGLAPGVLALALGLCRMGRRDAAGRQGLLGGQAIERANAAQEVSRHQIADST